MQTTREVPVDAGNVTATGTPGSAQEFSSHAELLGTVAMLAESLPTDEALCQVAKLIATTLALPFCGTFQRLPATEGFVLRLATFAAGAWSPWHDVPHLDRSENSISTLLLTHTRPVVFGSEELEQVHEPWFASRGIRSGAVIPLRGHARVLGGLAGLDTLPRRFSLSELQLLTSIGQVLSSALAARQLDEELRNCRALFEATFQAAEVPLVFLDRQGCVKHCNAAFEALTGRASAEIVGQPFVRIFCDRGQASELSKAIHDPAAHVFPLRFESTLDTQHGVQRRIRWSFARTETGADAGSLVGALVDFTAEFAALQRAARAEALIERNRLNLQTLATAVTRGDMAEIHRAALDLTGSTAPGTATANPRAPAVARGTGERANRMAPRAVFRQFQRIAPIVDGLLPPDNRLLRTMCHDLSASGISFLLPTAPSSTEYLVALGEHPNLRHVRAVVRHHRPIQVDGVTQYLVGCQFIERIATLPNG